jgi:succinyl-CoA synthetase beta subunit
MLSSSLVLHAARRTAGPAVGAVRNLNVHEYISMEIMNKYQIATPKGHVASTPEEAERICIQSFQQGV